MSCSLLHREKLLITTYQEVNDLFRSNTRCDDENERAGSNTSLPEQHFSIIKKPARKASTLVRRHIHIFRFVITFIVKFPLNHQVRFIPVSFEKWALLKQKKSNSFFNLIVDRVFQTKMLFSFNFNDFKNVALASQYCYRLARFRHRNMYLIGRDHLPLGKL